MFRRSDKLAPEKQLLNTFEKEIGRQENIIYGVALFFECLSLIHADEPSVLETYRKQFRNIIQLANNTVKRAQKIHEAAKENPEAINLIKTFQFSPCHGHPNPEMLQIRAENLVAAYIKIFPDRPKEKDLSKEETLKLLEAVTE